MRCRICGAKLAKENADICINCYKEYQEEEELKKDVNERLVVKRKYKITYVLLQWMEAITILIISTLGLVAVGKPMEAILCAIFSCLIIVVVLAIRKRIAKGTKAVFYETKVVYTVKNWLYNNEKVIKYTDIKDITVFQTFRQKKMNFGDICFYVKSNIPGVAFFNGFQIKDVENVAETLQSITEIIGITENK